MYISNKLKCDNGYILESKQNKLQYEMIKLSWIFSVFGSHVSSLFLDGFHGFTHLTTSTAPGLTLGSFPDIDMLAVKEPSILKMTVSVLGGSTHR